MEQLRGKLRQKEKGGPFYYRLTVADGVRKEFSLKTCDEDEARQKAANLDSVWEAPTTVLSPGTRPTAKNISGSSRFSRNLQGTIRGGCGSCCSRRFFFSGKFLI